MTKFKVGDRIRSKYNGYTGIIEDINFNSLYQQYEYVVRWEAFTGFSKIGCYSQEEADDLWELDTSNPFYTQPEHIHEWAVYDSGFSRFEYCKTCNKERK